MSLRELASGIYQIGLAWSNAYLLIENSEAALIDTGLQADRPALLAALASLGIAPEQIGLVLLTHAHCDHAGSATWLSHANPSNANRAQIAVGHAEAPFLMLPRRSYAPRGVRKFLRPLKTAIFEVGERIYPVERGLVDVLLSDGDVVDAPGGSLRVLDSPGHTAGHIAFYRERDGVLFSGDAILNIIPIWRKTTLSLSFRVLSDDWQATIASARRLAETNPRILLSGHGFPLTDNTARRIREWAQAL